MLSKLGTKASSVKQKEVLLALYIKKCSHLIPGAEFYFSFFECLKCAKMPKVPKIKEFCLSHLESSVPIPV